MRSRTRLGVAGALALFAVSVAVPASAVSVGATRTRWVDDDGKAGPTNCGGSRSATKRIQTAVDRSDRNDVVIVCPGTYHEQFGVQGSKLNGVTVRAYSKWTAVVRMPDDITDGPAIWVEDVSNVLIQGLAIEFPDSGCDPHVGDLQGLWASNADGVRIYGNRFRTTGSDTQGDCGYDDGIRVLSSTSFRVANNTVRDFQSDGISIESGSRGKVDGNTVQFYHSGSSSSDDGDQGIRVVGGARAEVTGNLVRSLSGAGHPHLELGIVVQNAAGGSDVHHNDIHYVKQGMGSIDSKVEFRYNDLIGTSEGGASGIFADDGDQVTGSQILSNKVRSFDAGIWVDASGITLRHNDARGSITNSCVDTSTGSGTSGTANLWSSSNIGSPVSDPTGICQLP
ncbi:MAG: right-handed parallel beta-helix repeat-containing protein [Chloroflexota bacterium]